MSDGRKKGAPDRSMLSPWVIGALEGWMEAMAQQKKWLWFYPCPISAHLFWYIPCLCQPKEIHFFFFIKIFFIKCILSMFFPPSPPYSTLWCFLALSLVHSLSLSKKQKQKRKKQEATTTKNKLLKNKIQNKQAKYQWDKKNPQRKQNKKSTQKHLWVNFVLADYFWAWMVLTLDCGWSKCPPPTPCDIPLDKTLCSRYQLQITSWLGVRPCPLPPFSVRPHLASTCPGLVCVATVSVNS